MSVVTEDQKTSKARSSTPVEKPMSVVVCCYALLIGFALLTVVVTALSGVEALVLSVLGMLLMFALFGLTHLFDWVLAKVAMLRKSAGQFSAEQISGEHILAEHGSSENSSSSKTQSISCKPNCNDLRKRLLIGVMIRAGMVIAATAIAIRDFGVDSKLAVSIVMPLYCGLLLAEIAYALAQQSKNLNSLAKQELSLQARI